MLRGARLVVVDPRRTELAGLADVHLQGRPGSNVAVFNGLARLLIDGGLDRPRRSSPTRADGLDELREVLGRLLPPSTSSRSPASRRGSCALAARLYGTAEVPAIVYGLGVTEHAHGTDGVRTLANLAILRGAVGTERGGGVNPLRGQNNVQGASDMGALPDLLPGYQQVTDAGGPATGSARVWGVRAARAAGAADPGYVRRRPRRAGAARCTCWVRTSPRPTRTARTCGPPSRPASSSSSQEIFLSETARLADVVLPAASFLEKDGTFVNFDRRFQRVRPALRAARRRPYRLRHPARRSRASSARTSAVHAGRGAWPSAPPSRRCSPASRHERLDRDGALHWPCRSETDPGEATLYSDAVRDTERAGRSCTPSTYLPPGEQPTRVPVHA